MTEEKKTLKFPSKKVEEQKEEAKQRTALVLVVASTNDEYTDSLTEYYKAHAQYDTDTGVDIPFCRESVVIPKNQIRLVGLGIKAVLCVGVVQADEQGDITVKQIVRVLPFMLVARSSVYKKGLIVCNGFGVIDMDYRGELKMPLYSAEKDATITPMERISQIVCYTGMPIDGVVVTTHDGFVKTFNNTKRGEGGFGSTGQ